MIIAGVDEAGRGAVIGPLVVACVSVRGKYIPKLVSLGVKDSKLLDYDLRFKLANDVRRYAYQIEYKVVDAKTVDKAVYKHKLNRLELTVMAELLNKVKYDIAVIDSPLRDCAKVVSFLSEKVEGRVLAFNYADRKFVTVACASIIAKTIRDGLVEALKEKFGDFGTGYPSDPKTIAFIREHGSEPIPIIRNSWLTVKRLFSVQKTLLDFTVDEKV
ncbi:MAG: ribonuclease HII [Thermoproteota archaeon]|nr:MAG: ribonuclease HII [Candidatus Korarchaeota archaeon]